MSAFIADVRFALRLLMRHPGFACIAVAMLALGLGSVSAVFSLVNAVLVDGLPFDRPDRLVFVRGVRQAPQGLQPYPLGLMDIDALGASRDVFESWSPVTANRPFNMSAGGEVEHVNGEMIGPEYFHALRIRVALGRPFSSDEAAPGTAQPVVVLSDELWRSRFGARADVLDESIELNDRRYRVIGVAAPGFHGLTDAARLWLPIGMAGAIYGTHYTQTREFRWLSAVGRLRDDVSLEQARQSAGLVASRLEKAFPRENSTLGFSVASFPEVFHGDLRTPLLALFGAAIFVLLIACANVSNMLLARGKARASEFAVRRALGADVRRLVTQLLTETAVLCGVGAMGGLVLAIALPRLVMALAPPSMRSFVSIDFDPVVLAFALAGLVVAVLLSGVVPAALVLRQPPARLLREGGGGAGGGTGGRFQRLLVALEVSLALALLIGATAMARGFGRFLSTDLGLDASSVLTMRLDLTAERFKVNERYWATAAEVLARVRAHAGVRSAALDGPGLPTGGSYAVTFRRVDAGVGDPDITGLRHHVSPGYFATLGIAIRLGRDFAAQDVPGADRVLIVSREFAERVWPDEAPIGQRLRAGTAPDAPVLTVVGVVENVRHAGRTGGDAWAPDVYVNAFQSPARTPATLTVLAKIDGTLDQAAGGLNAVVREGAGGVPPYDVRSLEARLDDQTASARFAVVIMAAFAGSALLLATGGVYGVVSYVVSQRTREVGLRMALGSSRAGVLYLLMRLGLMPVGVGALCGLVVAHGAGRYMTTLLYGLNATDPPHVVAMAMVLLVVAVAAVVIPALRALRISPAVALRGQ